MKSLFRNPWGIFPPQDSFSRQSYLVALESMTPPVLCRETSHPDSGTEPDTEPQEEVLQASVEIEEVMEAPQLLITSSSFSPDKAVMAAGVSSPQDDHKVDQDLKRVALNLRIQERWLRRQHIVS